MEATKRNPLGEPILTSRENQEELIRIYVLLGINNGVIYLKKRIKKTTEGKITPIVPSLTFLGVVISVFLKFKRRKGKNHR